MYKLTVMPSGQIIEVDEGENLRQSLIKNGLSVKSPCGGCASCGQCIITVKDGLNNLSDISFEEKQLLGNIFHMTQERLSCQTTIVGDVTVDITNHMEKKATPVMTKRRTKDEAEKIIEERKENSKNRPERQGGFKKPKSFTSSSD